MEYHKIQSLFKRDSNSHKFIIGDWTLSEFEYLSCNKWSWTEKVDGTNIRIAWDHLSRTRTFGGRTDNAQIPAKLVARLEELFPSEALGGQFSDVSVTLYGEGYGATIQKVGGNYKPDGVDFVLFDVRVGNVWLERDNVDDIAAGIGVQSVPVIGVGTLHAAIEYTRNGFTSTWGEFAAEGIVARPLNELQDRRGRRIITKIKTRDFI